MIDPVIAVVMVVVAGTVAVYGPIAAGSWLIPIAFTAAAVVSIARFNADLPAYAAYAPLLLQTGAQLRSQPKPLPEHASPERSPRGQAF